MLDDDGIELTEELQEFVKGELRKEGSEGDLGKLIEQGDLGKLIEQKERQKAEAKAKEAEAAEAAMRSARAVIASLQPFVWRGKKMISSFGSKMNFANYVPDPIIEDIVRNCGLANRLKFSAASKGWQVFVNNIRKESPLTSDMGIMTIYAGVTKERVTLWKLENEGTECVQVFSDTTRLSFVNCSAEYLLFRENYYDRRKEFQVTHPLEKLQWKVPFHPKAGPHPKFATTGHKQFLLLFQLFQHTNVVESTTRFVLFNSGCHEWEERVVYIRHSYLMKEKEFKRDDCNNNGIFWQQKFYSFWSSLLMEYDVDNDVLTLFRIPKGMHLLESKSRLLLYRWLDSELHLWRFQGQDSQSILKKWCAITEISRGNPLFYDEDLGIIYVSGQDTVLFSYRLENHEEVKLLRTGGNVEVKMYKF
ncbi:hypothetical protein SO802_014270 [Lithocarpus litseifolius]|uniref:F-box domain-containing protein n=1 Tax=Lithocarpus litseifolius TaxID=425828 RepID=A0AAW2CSN6_9ROSI